MAQAHKFCRYRENVNIDRQSPPSRRVYATGGGGGGEWGNIKRTRGIELHSVYGIARKAFFFFFPFFISSTWTVAVVEQIPQRAPDSGLSRRSRTNVFLFRSAKEQNRTRNAFSRLRNTGVGVQSAGRNALAGGWRNKTRRPTVMRSAGLLDISGLWIIKISDGRAEFLRAALCGSIRHCARDVHTPRSSGRRARG